MSSVEGSPGTKQGSSFPGNEKLRINLLTCTVKTGTGTAKENQRPFCFRIISPTQTLTLQAEGERERSQWVDAVQGMVAELLNARASATAAENADNAATAKEIEKLRKMSGNDKCADCGASDPDWASLNLGILICQHCAGAHRFLGVQHSKVRSLALDVKSWSPDIIAMFMGLGGNTAANRVWEANLAQIEIDDPEELRVKVLSHN